MSEKSSLEVKIGRSKYWKECAYSISRFAKNME
jgi:hypothetical protein